MRYDFERISSKKVRKIRQEGLTIFFEAYQFSQLPPKRDLANIADCVLKKKKHNVKYDSTAK